MAVQPKTVTAERKTVMNHSAAAFKAREQLKSFLGELSPRFSKPLGRFVGDMLYGIQAAQDVKLSEVARELDGPASMKKREDRLSRMLRDDGIEPGIFQAVARLGARRVRQDTLVVIDPTDIRKLYARKMEYLARVRDGSTGEIGNGYSACLAVACESGGRRVTPLNFRLWSSEADGFASQNDEIMGIIDLIRGHAKRRGIYVIDRGGDGDWLFDGLDARGLDFIVRLVGNRTLLHGKRAALAEGLAASCAMRYAETVTRETEEGLKRYEVQFGMMTVALPQRPGAALRMVVVKGSGEKPVMLLTTLAETDSRKALWQVVEGYLTRWRVEDALRFVKQSYNLEDIRVLKYRRLKNMAALLLAVIYFNCVWLAGRLRCEILASNIAHAAKRIHGVAEFMYYAVADGLGRLFSRHGRWRPPEPRDERGSNPLGLVFLE
jgi:hypothetical protein